MAVGPIANVLREDRGFAAVLTPEEQRQALPVAVARTAHFEPGVYAPAEMLSAGEGLLGLLVLEGIVIRHVVVAERRCGELVAEGAILRPWDHFGEQAPLPFEIRWRVLQPLRVAVLDERWLRICARWPALFEVILARAVERAHTLAFNVGIHCLNHVELRLIVLLWHLADRFGRVGPDGVRIPLPLRHEDFAELVGARRPTVSAALSRLAKDGTVCRLGNDGWLLSGDPPTELKDMRGARAASRDDDAE